jgi:TonB family protein
MEAFAMYLLKSVIWLSGFAAVFILFLRNERFFHLNRIYLISGILTSFLFPLLTIYYKIDLPATGNIQVENIVPTGIRDAGSGFIPETRLIILAIYGAGVLFVTFMILKQSRSVLKTIKKSDIICSYQVKLIRTADYAGAFSFFSYVFVNPSVTDVETEEIVNHELVHIRQKHWVDLVLVGLLCVFQWFNPFIWIYVRLVRQNHEYLADEVALQRTSDPAVYRATLLNQIVGTPVISLANSFNYSLNKKRFNMMKNKISSPYRKMKIFLILPVFAIVLYAFAKPDYSFGNVDYNPEITPWIPNIQNQDVKGIVVEKTGKPLNGAVILIKGTTIGTSSDANGSFMMTKVPGDVSLLVSYVGFKSKVIKPVFSKDMKIEMIRDTVMIGMVSVPPPPPPPPPPPFDFKFENGKPPLVIVDGIEKTYIDLQKVDPNTIQTVSVLKDKSAIEVFGDKGKDGVIVVTTKENSSTGKNEKVSKVEVTGYGDQKVQKDLFIVVEEMPVFPDGGEKGMLAWIYNNIKYPGEAVKKNITGQVIVNFVVSGTGKIEKVRVDKPGNPLLDTEAIRVVSAMSDWKPGKQNGKPIDVYMKIPINFKLN